MGTIYQSDYPLFIVLDTQHSPFIYKKSVYYFENLSYKNIRRKERYLEKRRKH